MTQDLTLALQELKQAVVANRTATAVLTPDVLNAKFHGLSLRQLVLLTDAPALAVFSEQRAADGSRVERFIVDGKDEQQCGLAARQILLSEEASLQAGDIREVCVAANDRPSPILVRDHNDIVYRVTDREATIDQELTGALQHRRQSLQGDRSPHLAAVPRQPVIVTDGFAFNGTAGEVLHGLAAVRLRNGVALQAIQKLIAASGARDLDAALAATSPEMLHETFGQIIVAAQQIDALLEVLAQRTRALLRLVSQSGAAEGAASMVGDGPMRPPVNAGPPPEQPARLAEPF